MKQSDPGSHFCRLTIGPYGTFFMISISQRTFHKMLTIFRFSLKSFSFLQNYQGKISSITYLGKEELHAESLWGLVGLSATFLNHLVQRQADGDIPDIIEFLTDEWAVALFHDRFMDFQTSLAETLEGSEQVTTNQTYSNFLSLKQYLIRC